MPTKKEGLKKDPFKTRKTREAPAAAAQDTVTPPDEVQEAIDLFREAQEQAKHFEGEMTIHKDRVVAYCQDEFSRRVYSGLEGSFKLLGESSVVMYVVMDSSAGLSEEDAEEFASKWGDDAAKELIVRDYGSVRFDPAVLEANYDSVVEALQTLPEHVLEKLFKPMLMKARPGALQVAKQFAKSPEKLSDILRDLRIKNYIR